MNLSAGKHVLKLEIVGNYVNIDWLNFADPADTATTRLVDMQPLYLKADERGYDVFGMDGQFVCHIEGVQAQGGIKAALAAKGVNPGVYMVRDKASRRSVKVNTVR